MPERKNVPSHLLIVALAVPVLGLGLGCGKSHVLDGPGGLTDGGGGHRDGGTLHVEGGIVRDGGPSLPRVDAGPPGPPDLCKSLGSAGGTLRVGQLRLHVPPDALMAPTRICIHQTAEAPPPGFTAYSAVYRFEPVGTVFRVPAQVQIGYDGTPSRASVFWTGASNDGFVALPTDLAANVATAGVTHFSRGFVGTACTGGRCCGRAQGKLDLLFVVDNSNGMDTKQTRLLAEIPHMVTTLTTGDLDGDGVQDVPAVADLHVGVVSSDMGSGGFMVPTCGNGDMGPTFGDDGILRTAADPSAGCAASYPPFQTYDASDPSADSDALAHDLSCVAALGTEGCGFEQQLESPLKALTPSTSTVTFSMGTVGLGDGPNAGFLRNDSTLAVLLLTDEDACTPSNPELFDPNTSNASFPGDLSLRCFMYPGAVQPASRYVDGLLALRGSPDHVIFAAIVGVPADLVADPTNIDYDAILADPRMHELPDPMQPSRLAPSCSMPGLGLAFPPRRIVQVARGINQAGATSIVQSICHNGGFAPAVDAITRVIAHRLAGACSGGATR